MKSIKIEQISFAYDEVDVLHEFSLEIGKEEGCILLAGRNGSGKSTLLNLLCGSLLPYEGAIEREGIHIGYLPFDSPLIDQLSVLDNLRYFYRCFHHKDFDLKEPFIQKVLQTMSIDYLNQRVNKCSSGQKQKAGIAMILLSGADMIVMDEPFVAIDSKSVIQLIELLQEMKKHTTILLTTHTIDQLESLADRLILLNEKDIAIDTKDKEQLHAYFKGDIL